MSVLKNTDPRPWCTSPAEAEEEWALLKQLEDECLDKNGSEFHELSRGHLLHE